MRKLTKDEKTLLSMLQAITRKWLYGALQQGLEIPEERVWAVNSIEESIYATWHKDCLDEMRKEKLHLSVPELFSQVSDPKVSVIQALKLARRFYTNKNFADRQKHIGKIISKLQRLYDKEKVFYRQSLEQMETVSPIEAMKTVADRLGKEDKIEAEYRLYTIQSIKHIRVLISLGCQASAHEYYQALDPRFAADSDLYQKQINLVLGTYTEGEDVPADIKDVCFEFIKESIPRVGYLHASLIEYIFANDCISDRAFKLFLDAEKCIKEYGMGVLISYKAKNLADALGLEVKEDSELSASERNILELIKIFESPQIDEKPRI